VKAVLEALDSFPGMRLAKPGEFVRRAYHAGKMDLVQLESVADLLLAETEAQRIQALQAMGGSQTSVYSRWRKELLSCLASVEAVLDFGEDAELSEDVALAVVPRVINLRQELQKRLADGRRGELIRDGLRAVLLGPVNAGKSSVLNLMAGREAAIVSPFPGTTRDVVEVPLELGGFKVLLSDSAGIRDAKDPVESEGISRAMAASLNADVAVVVLDSSTLLRAKREAPLDAGHRPADVQEFFGRMAAERAKVTGGLPGQEASVSAGRPLLVLLNKADILGGNEGHELAAFIRALQSFGEEKHLLRVPDGMPKEMVGPRGEGIPVGSYHPEEGYAAAGPGGGSPLQQRAWWLLQGITRALGDCGAPRVVALSCKSQAGAGALVGELESAVVQVMGQGQEAAAADAILGRESVVITRHRHRVLLQECIDCLHSYEGCHEELELAAEELRAAAKALGSVTGAIETEEVLEVIFGEFCIGK